MLGRQHYGVDAVRLAVDIAHRDLALGVRAQERQAAVLAQLGLALDQTVRVVNRRRHQFRGFVAGIAEHQALVAGTGVQVVVAGMVHALGDVIALLVIGDQHRAALVIDAVFGVVIANALDGVARNLDIVDMGVGGDFAGQHDQTGIGQGFGRDTAAWVLLEDSVQNRIGNLVRHLVRVAFRDGFGRKEKVVRHLRYSND